MNPEQGFALVIVASMMVLLVVIAVGLLGMASISLRGSEHEARMRVARANARLAMELAIGQLQLEMGPDQRITTSAGILQAPDEGAQGGVAPRNWTGVWNAAASTSTDFDDGRPKAFRKWLVTTAAEDSISAPDSDSRPMVEMQLDPGGTTAEAPLIGAPGGRLGWLTSDESMKAPLDLAEQEAMSMGERVARNHAPDRPTPEIDPSLAALKSDPATAAKMLTLGQAELAGALPVAGFSSNYTVGTRSVLSNVRDGGLKKDISSLFELPEISIPKDLGVWTGQASFNDPKVYLYGQPGIALGARWNHLFAYYNLYRDVRRVGGVPMIEPANGLIDWHLADRYQNFGDEAGGFRFPRISKVIYVFSYMSRSTGRGNYQLELGTDIFVTLWNPFDTGILFPANTTFFAKFSKGLPFRFQWYLNDAKRGGPTALQQIADGGSLFVSSEFRNPGNGRLFQMAPGETLVFSMKSIGGGSIWGTQPVFEPGIYYDKGLASDNVMGPGGQLTGLSADNVSVGLEPVNDVPAYTIGGVNTSQYIDFWIYDTQKKWPYYEHRGELIAKGSTDFIRHMKSIDKDRVRSVTLAEVASRRQPFAAFVMESRTAMDSVNPVPQFLHTGNTRLSSRLDGDVQNLAYERMEYRLEPVSGWDSDLIQATLEGDPAGANHGYIGSGRIPATGRTHMTALSIPAVPPVSLASFRHAGVGDGAATLRATHWGFNSTPNPNFSDGSVGNSYAHPLISPNRAVEGTLYDHSFLVNEALWDSWFLSSLSPRSGGEFNEARGIQDVFRDFMNHGTPLLNPRMKPYPGSSTSADLEKRYFRNQVVQPVTYKEIAARLMLAGPFNVNSTSVDAWAGFLASTRNHRIEKVSKTGGPSEWVSSEGTLFSRTERIMGGSVDSEGSMDSQYGGFRDLSDDDIRVLAEEIVAEVRSRGPFLNLAEFVNRRLSSDSSVSLSGALQTAIDRSKLNEKLRKNPVAGTRAPMGARVRNGNAAALDTAAGAPGWLMQADILDPLGPFLVVRGDTFRIRGYGEATDASGNVVARAWCEAVVQRNPEWLDPAEDAATWPVKLPRNQRFGRRFTPVSFRWLAGPDA